MLSRLLPQRLITRLLVMFTLMISIILSLYAWRSAHHETESRLDAFKAQSDALTYQIGVSSQRFIITGDYAELENIIRAFVRYPGVQKLVIVDEQQIPVVAAENRGERVVIDYRLEPVAVDLGDEGTQQRGRQLVSTRAITIGHQHYWIYLERDNTAYLQLRQQALYESFAWALLGSLISLLILYAVIRRPMQQLQNATRFARSLVQQTPAPLDISHGGLEVRVLGQALSEAARELNQRDDRLQKQQALLDTIRQLQTEFIAFANVNQLFDKLLKSMLEYTQSRYGFIGEVIENEAGLRYLKTYAITDISWDDSSQLFYEDNIRSGLEFYNLDTLFGEVIKSGRSLIANDPQHHPAAAGVPHGHPPLESFMGLAVNYGEDTIGVIGLANREQGYEAFWLDELKPLLSTCGQLIDAFRSYKLRARMEEALQDSRRMLLTVLDTIPGRVFWKDRDGKYLGCNRKFMQDAGQATVNDLIGLSDEQLPWAQQAGQYRAEDEQVIHSAAPLLNFEVQQTGVDGELRWLQVSKIPLTNNRGEIIGVLGSYDDITERKLSQDRIRDSQQRLAQAQRIAHLGNWQVIFASDNQAERNIWSDESFRILGLEPGREDPGFDLFLQHLDPEERERLRQYIEVKIQQGEDYSHECRIHRRDGEERYISVSAELMRDGDRVVGVLGTMQDITERKQVERIKDEFISTVSHELRTPLTSIRGSLGLVRGLVQGDDLPEKISSLLDIAHNNTERLLHLINDILDISKIESGELALSYQRIALQSFLEQVVSDNQTYVEDVRIKLSGNIDDLIIEADPGRLTQILNNLISNACKFSPKGSEVAISALRDGNHVRIYVVDQGPGIPQAYQRRIFEKFTQADSSNTRDASGTGLGLSISKALVEQHGGYIGFDSMEGEGTTFYFVLPMIKPQHVESSGRVASVLICEDDRDIAAIIQQMVAHAGLEAEVVYTAQAARSALAAGEYQALILDIMLPGEDGISLLQDLRGQARYQALDVIIVSARAGETHARMQGNALGVYDWLNKPIDEQRLMASLDYVQRKTGHGLPRILHVEDDADIAYVVKNLLQDDAEVVQASTLQQAQDYLDGQRFDLLLLDLALPDGNGVELLPQIDAMPIVVFAAEVNEQPQLSNRVAAILTKSRVSNEELQRRIQGLLRG